MNSHIFLIEWIGDDACGVYCKCDAIGVVVTIRRGGVTPPFNWSPRRSIGHPAVQLVTPPFKLVIPPDNRVLPDGWVSARWLGFAR